MDRVGASHVLYAQLPLYQGACYSRLILCTQSKGCDKVCVSLPTFFADITLPLPGLAVSFCYGNSIIKLIVEKITFPNLSVDSTVLVLQLDKVH